jgi:hypothetical protein
MQFIFNACGNRFYKERRQRRKDFSSKLCVQTGSGAHPALYTMGTGCLSPGVKRGRGVTLNIHPQLVPKSRMSRSYTPSLPCAAVACNETALPLAFCRKKWTSDQPVAEASTYTGQHKI